MLITRLRIKILALAIVAGVALRAHEPAVTAVVFPTTQQPDAAQIEFFETRVRPVLADSCFSCHTEAPKAGLRVDSREALLKGGRRGPAIIPGNAADSLLIQAIAHTNESPRMPKGAAKLSEQQITDLTKWVRDGAAWPVATAAVKPAAEYTIRPEHKKHWSFQLIANPVAPQVSGQTRNDVDAFLLAKLEARKLRFNAPAGKRALLRRATYDLTGLPPTMAEIEAFLADKSPDAFARVVDRLLASPHYGERWGRHWMDVARYSDTLGMIDAGRNLQGWFPFAWTWRDWVIQALNADMPYDQFILQQIAADKLPGNDTRNLAALGFLSLSRGGLGVNQHERIDDKIDVVSRGLMGLTVSCARCHNHKFDPIPTRDYYAFYTIFNNTREPKDLPLLDPENADLARWQAETKAEEDKVAADIGKMREKRYPELLKLYCTAPEIAKSLRGVDESRALKTDDELQKFAQEKDYNSYILKRWRAYLDKCGADEIWTLWQRLSAIPEKEFTDKAASVIASATNINPLLAAAFRQTPASLRDAAELYGQTIAAYDKPQPLADKHEEQLRLVLHAPESPASMPFADYELFRVSVDKQNEDGRRRKLESLFLEQAWRGAPARAQALEDNPEPKPGHVFLRGKPENKGEAAPPQFLLILAGADRKPFTNGSGRLELAQAIIARDNPLTARVLANRVWMLHFGAGLVSTPGDFGTRGDTPTHPELLDYLARYLIDNKWSLKKLHRHLMLSRAYQQSSADNAAARNADPENRMLWRASRRRLDLEELRDSLLTVSGRLDRAMAGLPVSAQAWPYTHRRTVYSFIDRALVPGDFRAFDFPNPELLSPQRYLTTVPQQALLMLNSPFVIEQAKSLLARPELSGAIPPRLRIQRLYQLVYGRAPRPAEIAMGLQFTSDPANATPGGATRTDAWQYGEGEYDDKEGLVKSFAPLSHHINGQWRNTPFPGDPRGTTASLDARGGTLGDGKTHSAIRRWTVPFDGRVRVTGLLQHSYENACRNCKGVFARLVSSRAGAAGRWETVQGKTETSVALMEVKRGDILDFVVEGGKGTAGGEFKWAVTISRLDAPGETWDSARDFRQPSAGPLSAWDRYAQTLLASAEFLIID
ncbi:MAG: PSD1 and planctomycete cytochrome C domain-containing protein [Blastocatellia bacterium]